MSVRKPGRVLLTHTPLSFVQNDVTGRSRKSLDLAIPLVPFIDFLITLVVFLLSPLGNAPAQAEGALLNLPSATNVDMLKDAPVITIDRGAVTLQLSSQAVRITDVEALERDAQLEALGVLIGNLRTYERNYGVLHPNALFPSLVIVQADRHSDFRVIKKVLFSCAQAGYSNINLAVNRRTRGGSSGG